mmetsp:Transcript_8477/g.24350  ORF Transcript_8477/g.24350 Transcript_8477/m.24350 type:complete len:317 (-) Transcript_8477:237-1187(-)
MGHGTSTCQADLAGPQCYTSSGCGKDDVETVAAAAVLGSSFPSSASRTTGLETSWCRPKRTSEPGGPICERYGICCSEPEIVADPPEFGPGKQLHSGDEVEGGAPTVDTSVGSRDNNTDMREETDTSYRVSSQFPEGSNFAEAWLEPTLNSARSDEASPRGNDTIYGEVVTTPGLSNEIYRGQVHLETGQFNGHGTYISSETTVTGMWVDGQLHGYARQTWQDGRLYEGEFRRGMFHGNGRMVWNHPRGRMVYEGEYFEDKKHGHGKFTWPSGRSYEGQWVNGKREGIGVDTSCAGTQCRGVWEDNMFIRAISGPT